MTLRSELHPEYITDAEGRRKAVVLPVEEFELLLEDLEDLAVAAERRNEPGVPHAQAKAELKQDGCL